MNAESDASDVDVLVVYNAHADIGSIHNAVAPHTLRFPLDVTYMSEAEEREFDFIREQDAKLLSEVLT